LLECWPDYVQVDSLPELEPEDSVELIQALMEAGLVRYE
jgi:hypothetical protein